MFGIIFIFGSVSREERDEMDLLCLRAVRWKRFDGMEWKRNALLS